MMLEKKFKNSEPRKIKELKVKSRVNKENAEAMISKCTQHATPLPSSLMGD